MGKSHYLEHLWGRVLHDHACCGLYSSFILSFSGHLKVPRIDPYELLYPSSLSLGQPMRGTGENSLDERRRKSGISSRCFFCFRISPSPAGQPSCISPALTRLNNAHPSIAYLALKHDNSFPLCQSLGASTFLVGSINSEQAELDSVSWQDRNTPL